MTDSAPDKPVTGTVKALYRYPVKGMTAEALDSVEVGAGQGFPDDRRFGLAIAGITGSSAKSEWMSWRNFLMLKKSTKLAALEAKFDSDTEVLTIYRAGRQISRGKPTDRIGRSMLEDFFGTFLRDELNGKRPKLVESENVHFSDNGENQVSLLNLGTLKDIERVAGQPIDVRRLRGNIIIEGAAPWAEKTWIGREIQIGRLRLKVMADIDRCAAPNVNPDTAVRDINLVKDLQRGFGHIDCGVYCKVLQGGTLAIGDALK